MVKNIFHNLPNTGVFERDPTRGAFLLKSRKNRELTDLAVLKCRQWYARLFKGNVYTRFYTLNVSPFNSRSEMNELDYEEYVKELFTICRNVLGVWFIFEKSEAGKLHLHGFIASKDKSKFLKIKKHLLFHSEIDEVTYFDGWLAYCLKHSPKHSFSCYGVI